MREFFENRLGEKGHSAETGLMRSNAARRTREECKHGEKEPPDMSVEGSYAGGKTSCGRLMIARYSDRPTIALALRFKHEQTTQLVIIAPTMQASK